MIGVFAPGDRVTLRGWKINGDPPRKVGVVVDCPLSPGGVAIAWEVRNTITRGITSTGLMWSLLGELPRQVPLRRSVMGVLRRMCWTALTGEARLPLCGCSEASLGGWATRSTR